MDVTCHLSLIILQLSLSLHTSTSLPSVSPPLSAHRNCLSLVSLGWGWRKAGKSEESSRVKDGESERWGLGKLGVHRRKGVSTHTEKTHTLAPSLIPPRGHESRFSFPPHLHTFLPLPFHRFLHLHTNFCPSLSHLCCSHSCPVKLPTALHLRD